MLGYKYAPFKPSSCIRKDNNIILLFFLSNKSTNAFQNMVATPDPASLAPREKGWCAVIMGQYSKALEFDVPFIRARIF
jgi:hypothetical protein